MKNNKFRIFVIAAVLVMAFACSTFALTNAEPWMTVAPPENYYDYEPGTYTRGDWTYTVENKTITAKNSVSGKVATVTIDTSSVYEMARTYAGGKVEYEVVRESHWSEMDGIAEYFVFYSGYEVEKNGDTSKYTDIYHRPESNGTYTVRIALFEGDDSDDGIEVLTTESIPYYLAMFSDFKVTEMGDNEIDKLSRPPLDNNTGAYVVSTRDEYLWVYYRQPNSDIILMNDIVINPIVITDEGYVLSAQNLVYKLQGFGSKAYWGPRIYENEFDGKGHTVYGLYFNGGSGSTADAGLIYSMTSNAYVHDVIIDNFYFEAGQAGGIVGSIWDYSTDENREYCIENCTALNGYVASTKSVPNEEKESGCGGICGVASFRIDSDNMNKGYFGIGIRNCTSLARVNGNVTNAGGIIGYVAGTQFRMDKCNNLGPVTGRNAGGIAGLIFLENVGYQCGGEINECTNAGNVNGSNCSGGIVGRYRDKQWSSKGKELDVYYGTSIGVVSTGKYTGGIIGGLGAGRATFLNCRWFGMNQSYQTVSGENSAGIDPEYAPNNGRFNISRKGQACKTIGHVISPIWTIPSGGMPDCEHTGYMVRKCLLCGENVYTQTIPETGHNYDGEDYCKYCGAERPEEEDQTGISQYLGLIGSVFAGPNAWIFVTVIVLIIAAVAVIIVRKKKNNNA